MESEISAILDDSYLAHVETLPIERVRDLRHRCQELETDVSYLRRLVQGRLDIATTELARRHDGGDPADLHSLIEQLPRVLADRTRGAATGRLAASFAPGDLRGELAEELLAIDHGARLTEIDLVDDAGLAHTVELLEDLERRVSDLRRALFGRIDTLGAELARRYRSGEASLGSLLRHAE